MPPPPFKDTSPKLMISERKPLRKRTRLAFAAGLSFFIASINGCEGMSWNEETLASSVRKQGEIRVLTLEHPLVDSAQGPARGMEKDLLLNFASSYGLKIRFLRRKTVAELYEGLRRGEADLAAGRLWSSEAGAGFATGPAFEDSHLSLFCRRPLKIENVKDLAGRRVGLAGKDNLDALDTRLREFVPSVELSLYPSASGRRMIEEVGRGTLDCAMVENLEGVLYARAWPIVEHVTVLTKDHSISWILQPNRTDLVSLMQAWFQRASRDDEIMRIQDQYRAGLSELDRHDARKFLQDVREKFPAFRKAFRESAARKGLDWQLLASVAYQESHWNADARSFTGVRGLMQLTQDTADHVGIEDRNDPLQSIWGGASYLRMLLNQMPRSIEPHERVALALAAYNCGIAHLRDAQTLAVQRGLNPYSWRHLKMTLPLLENPEIAAELPAGLARGRETVRFVERVRAFHGLWQML